MKKFFIILAASAVSVAALASSTKKEVTVPEDFPCGLCTGLCEELHSFAKDLTEHIREYGCSIEKGQDGFDFVIGEAVLALGEPDYVCTEIVEEVKESHRDFLAEKEKVEKGKECN